MIDAGAFKPYDAPDVGMGADPFPDPEEDFLAAQPDIHRDRLPDMYQPFDVVSQAAGVANAQLFRVDSQPDHWAIAVSNTAGMAISVYVGNAITGYAVKLEPNGYAKLPGRGTDLYVVSTGGTAASYTVVALRGLDVDIRRGG